MGVLIKFKVAYAYTEPMDWFKEASGFDFGYLSNIQVSVIILFLS